MSYDILVLDKDSGEMRPITAEEERERRRKYRKIMGSYEDERASSAYERQMGL